MCKIESAVSDISTADQFSLLSIHAEQNGTLAAGRLNFSFGNGNEATNASSANGWGYVAPFDYEVVAWSIGLRLNTSTTVRLLVNEQSVGINLIAVNAIKGWGTASYSGVAGDVINFQTVQSTGGNDAVVAAVLKVKIP